ncbi:MAG: hypothetical protein ACHQ3P_04770 [Candidatus Limnocylindrales bacterium]
MGDWALPSWVGLISGWAWAFIWLAVADVIVEAYVLTRTLGDPLLSPDRIVTMLPGAVPILLPAAVLWRPGDGPVRFAQPLVAGSVAVAASSVLPTAATFLSLVAQNPFQIGPLVVTSGMRVAGEVLAFGGFVLMASAILATADRPTPRWVLRARAPIVLLAIVYAVYAIDRFAGIVSSGTLGPDPGTRDWILLTAVVGVVTALPVVGQAYLAWAVLGAGPSTRPRNAWLLAVVAVSIQQCLLAAQLLAVGLLTIGVSTYYLDELVLLLGASDTVGSVANVALVAAVALGLGRPVDTTADVGSGELDGLAGTGT